MSARSVNARRVALTQAAVIVAGSTGLLAPFLLYVWGHVQIVTAGYSVEVTEARLKVLEQENRALRVARARLSALPRIEERARRLGFLPVDPSRVVVVHDAGEREVRVPAPVPGEAQVAAVAPGGASAAENAGDRQ